MVRVWPIKQIQFAKDKCNVWKKVKSLIKSGDVFTLRYTANDDKSGYIYFSSYDGKSRDLIAALQRYELDGFIRYAKKGELLLMWGEE
ncbi:MAG: hypothetical protein KJ886_05860 [Candidatus Thermoplasmatota archaeon]|nr:hypothetical protein [Candidatus Thermoplasmatota archaeon]MCG2826277.1 hypothetical protein [Thermoplasmatales archaeon]